MISSLNIESVKHNLRKHRAVNREINAAFQYYLRNAGLQRAQAFRREIMQAIEHIEGFPYGCPPHIRNTRKWKMQTFPYFFFFRNTPQGPYVLAFAHAARKPGYWLERLQPEESHDP